MLLLFSILEYAVFFLYSLVTFTPEQVLPVFQLPYGALRAFLLTVEYLIPVSASAIVVAFSLGAPTGKRRGPGAKAEPVIRVVSSTLITFLFLTIIYTVLFAGFGPFVRGKVSSMEYQSTMARVFLAQAGSAKGKGNYAAAMSYADQYLRIDTNNQAVLDLMLDMRARMAKEQGKNPPQPAAERGTQGLETSATGRPDTEGLDATALLDKARFYYGKQDYFSAHYYATQAYALEPERTDALRLAALAWDKITAFTPAQQNAENSRLFEEKKAAYSALVSGNALTAYYGFLSLASRYPKDKDVTGYLEKSREAVQRSTFFVEEAQRIVSMPGTEDILFINGEDKGAVEAVSLSKMVETSSGTYVLGVEAVGYGPDGSVAYHFSAPYGKLAGNTLLLHAIGRDDPKVQYMPLYSAGTRPRETRDILAVKPTVEEMRALGVDGRGLSSLGLPALWRIRTSLGGFGLVSRDLSARILIDLLMPFVFLTLSFFAVSFGWAFRARYLGRPPALLFVLVPIVPLVISLLCLLWVHAHRVIAGFLVLAFGFGAALAVCGGLELVILAISLILLAGLTAD